MVGMPYSLTIQPSAAKQLRKIERRDRERIEQAILALDL